MRGARVHGIHDVRIEDLPEPALKPGEVLLRVPLVTLCASDMHVYLRGEIGGVSWDQPFVPGHECAGVVLDPNGTDLGKGTHVAIDPAIPCGKCAMCVEGMFHLCRHLEFMAMPPRHGAMCEKVALPRRCLFPVPDGMELGEIALLEPLSVAVHAVELARLKPGATIAVLGCGGIGLCILLVARAKGAGVIMATDLVHERLVVAKQLGADETFVAEVESPVPKLLELTGGRGADVVFEAAGAQETQQQAVEACRPGGSVVLVGIPPADRMDIRFSDARRKELLLINVRRQNENYPEAISLVVSGKVNVKPILTHRFPLQKISRAYELMDTRAEGAIRVGIEP
jgi:L-iditol 2-dehydrogenase